MDVSHYAALAGIAYLIGSIPTGFLVARVKGVDIRQQGSGNIGATNVFRILGKKAGIFVLLCDALKGYLPVAFLPGGLGLTADAGVTPAMVSGLFAILGHNYTCWLRFKGGKGIATSAGVMLGLVPAALGWTLALWIVVFALSRYVSLASILAAAALPLASWLTGAEPPLVGLTLALGALAIFKHRANIQRLRDGTESRLQRKSREEPKENIA